MALFVSNFSERSLSALIVLSSEQFGHYEFYIITKLLPLSATIVPYCVDPAGFANRCLKLEAIEFGMSTVNKSAVKEC